ncbi:MAG: hypothetical protein ACPGXL_10455 [Chitinophagales bacterium]
MEYGQWRKLDNDDTVTMTIIARYVNDTDGSCVNSNEVESTPLEYCSPKVCIPIQIIKN